MPFVHSGLNSKTIKELEDIANIKKERYKFIGSTLFKNKDVIVSSVSAKYKAAGDLVNAAIEIYENSTSTAK